MANYSNLLAQIAANIYSNNNQEITGDALQLQLNAMVASLGAGYQFMGVAHPADTPSGYADLRAFWLAGDAGTYTNFGGLVLNDGEMAVIKYNGSWTKEVTGAATTAELSALRQQVLSKTSASGETLRNGFYKNDLSYQGLGGWKCRIFNLSQAHESIVVLAAPRSNGYVSLTAADNTILWQSNKASDFPKTIYLSDYPTAAKIYVSTETSVVATPEVNYYDSAFVELDSFIRSETAVWQNGRYINSSGNISSLSTWAAAIVEVKDAISLKITATFDGADAYTFLDDANGSHLLTLNNTTLTDFVINLSDYPTAHTLKVSSRKASPHSVIVSQLKASNGAAASSPQVSLRRGSFDSNHIIALPSPFSSFPLPVKISYYENCVGWNLSARDFTKNNAYGATYFVSPISGDDSADGLTPSTPFITIDNALAQADVNTIVLLDGTYKAGDNFTAGLIISKEVNLIGVGNVVVQNSGSGMEATTSIYVENITFVGGQSAFKTTLRDEICAFYQCRFLNSDNYNGLTALGGVYILEECEASNNLRDGFNYHKNEDDNYIAKALEINCVGYYNGVRHNTDINNGSTMHDDGVIIRLLCTYAYSQGTLVAETTRAASFNIGVVAYSTQNLTGDDTKRANYGEQYSGGTMYLVGCRSFGSKYDVFAETGSTIYRTLAFPKETGGGTFALYTISYL